MRLLALSLDRTEVGMLCRDWAGGSASQQEQCQTSLPQSSQQDGLLRRTDTVTVGNLTTRITIVLKCCAVSSKLQLQLVLSVVFSSVGRPQGDVM